MNPAVPHPSSARPYQGSASMYGSSSGVFHVRMLGRLTWAGGRLIGFFMVGLYSCELFLTSAEQKVKPY